MVVQLAPALTRKYVALSDTIGDEPVAVAELDHAYATRETERLGFLHPGEGDRSGGDE